MIYIADLDIPPPPILEEGIKVRKDVRKHRLDHVDHKWLSERRRELTAIKRKHKIRDFFQKIIPIHSKDHDNNINSQYYKKIEELIQSRASKIQLLRNEVNKWSQQKELTKNDRKLIAQEKKKIKHMEDQLVEQRQLLKKRKQEIQLEQIKREKQLQEQVHQQKLMEKKQEHEKILGERKKILEEKKREQEELRQQKKVEQQKQRELLMQKKKEEEGVKKQLELVQQEEIKKHDKDRISEIQQIQSELNGKIKSIKDSSYVFTQKQLTPDEIKRIKNTLIDENQEQFIFDVKNKINNLIELKQHKKTNLKHDINVLSNQFISFNNKYLAVKNRILKKLEYLEKGHHHIEQQKKSEAKQKFHEQLMEERKKELEQIAKKEHERKLLEIKNEQQKNLMKAHVEKIKNVFKAAEPPKHKSFHEYKKHRQMRDQEILAARKKSEQEIELERKNELEGLKKKDRVKFERMKELEIKLHIFSIDKTRLNEIHQLTKDLSESIKAITSLKFVLDEKVMHDAEIKKLRKMFHDEDEYRQKMKMIDNKVRSYKHLHQKKQTLLGEEIRKLAHAHDFYNAHIKKLRQQILDKFQHFEQQNVDDRKKRHHETKQRFHAQLMDERRKELEELHKHHQKKQLVEIKKHRLLKKLGIVPKKYAYYHEIDKAVENVKKDDVMEGMENLPPPPDILPSMEKNVDDVVAKEASALPDIEFQTNEKDWLKDYMKHLPRVKKAVMKAKRMKWEFEVKDKDWLKDFLSHRIKRKEMPHEKIAKIEEKLPKVEELFTKKLKSPKVEFDVEDDWLKDFNLKDVPRKIKKADVEELKEAKKYTSQIDYIEQMIHESRDALMRFDLRTAKIIYLDIMNVYNRMNEQDKAKVFGKIKELYDERKAAERLVA